ncbi:MAG TPA: adenosylmethionine decarboxylase [Candidatus Altiarchaeales archaeon]|nr:adenosylmethionine decarboxylase [Candidatus Altiarchaeales archaeon]
METLKKILKDVCEKSNLNIIKGDVHQFEPHGVTVFYILKESHISIHTWPEFSSAACDIFTCGEKDNILKAADLLLEKMKPKKVKKELIVRE